MARTTSSAVQLVLMKDYDTTNSPDLTPFIDTASAIIDRVATCATNKGITLSATELEIIERWLAAHAYAMSDMPYVKRVTGDAQATYQSKIGMYLEGTRYGQMAVATDYSGCLTAIANRKTAGAYWLGKPPSEQTDYVDRD